MSAENDVMQPERTDSTDPAGLPLFTTVSPGEEAAAPARDYGHPKGRRRGGFTLVPTAGPDGSSGSTRAVLPVGDSAGNVVPRPAPDVRWSTEHGWSETGLGWELVAGLRQQTADRLSQEGQPGGEDDRESQQDRGRAIITELLHREATERLRAGESAWGSEVQDALARAVFDAVFGLGRLQPLVDDPQVENIMIFGHDQVTVELTGGRQVVAPPVADSDQELVDFLMFVASRSEVNARSFSPSRPELHLRLDGGARLAAQAWVTPRPQVVIRRHRLTEVSAGRPGRLGHAERCGRVVPGRGGPFGTFHRGLRRPRRGQDHDGARVVQ